MTRKRWTVKNVAVTKAQYDAISFAIRLLADDDSPQMNRDSETLMRLRDKLKPRG
jgi:hypothetical protein